MIFFKKNIPLFFMSAIIIVFFSYIVFLHQERDRFVRDTYSRMIDSLLSQMTISIVFIDKAKKETDEENKLIYICNFASLYLSISSLIEDVKQDADNPQQFRTLNDYRGILSSEIGDQNIEVFFNEKCIDEIWRPK